MCSDLISAFGAVLAPVLAENKVMLTQLTVEGRRSRIPRTRTLASWATQELGKLETSSW